MDRLKTSPSFTDDEFIRAIRSGGLVADKAILALYSKYQKDIKSWIALLLFRRGYPKSDATEVVHDSFVTMLYKIQHETPVISSLKAYWLGIAKYHLYNLVRNNKHGDIVSDRELIEAYHEETPENILVGTEYYHHLEYQLNKCGIRCKELLLLWLADYSMDEIAERMGLSGAAIARKIKYKCFKKLKILVSRGDILG